MDVISMELRELETDAGIVEFGLELDIFYNRLDLLWKVQTIIKDNQKEEILHLFVDRLLEK